jgi:hypothetical protein
MPDDRFNDARPSGGGAHDAGSSPAALLGLLLRDLGDLAQKEMALARSEIQQKLMQKAKGAVWVGIGGLLLVVSLVTFVGGLVFYVESFDIALHWSAFFVAFGVAIVGLIALMIGKNKSSVEMNPMRCMRQVRRDIAIIKEQVQ